MITPAQRAEIRPAALEDRDHPPPSASIMTVPPRYHETRPWGVSRPSALDPFLPFIRPLTQYPACAHAAARDAPPPGLSRLGRDPLCGPGEPAGAAPAAPDLSTLAEQARATVRARPRTSMTSSPAPPACAGARPCCSSTSSPPNSKSGSAGVSNAGSPPRVSAGSNRSPTGTGTGRRRARPARARTRPRPRLPRPRRERHPRRRPGPRQDDARQEHRPSGRLGWPQRTLHHRRTRRAAAARSLNGQAHRRASSAGSNLRHYAGTARARSPSMKSGSIRVSQRYFQAFWGFS